jgi:hypothetical protein
MNKEHYKEDEEMGMGGHMMGMGCCKGMSMESKKAFKLALLKKKEKILEAKLEFLREMRMMMEKMPMDKKESEEE